MSVADMIEVARSTKFVAGLPNSRQATSAAIPGPHTSLGVFLGIKAAVKRALGKDSLDGLHIAHAGRGQRRDRRRASCLRRRRQDLSIADVDQAKAQKLADATGGTVVSPDEILGLEADVLSPNALGAILTEQIDRRAQGADRRGRRQQPARDARGRRAPARSAASSTRPIT